MVYGSALRALGMQKNHAFMRSMLIGKTKASHIGVPPYFLKTRLQKADESKCSRKERYNEKLI